MSDLIVNVKYTQRLRVVASLTRKKTRLDDPLITLLESFDMKPLSEATAEFRKLYVTFAIRKAGNQYKAANLLTCHRNVISRIMNNAKP